MRGTVSKPLEARKHTAPGADEICSNRRAPSPGERDRPWSWPVSKSRHSWCSVEKAMNAAKT